MTDLTERRLGWGFGIAGAILLFAGALVAFIMAGADLALSHATAAATSATSAVFLLVVGGLALFFAHLGNGSWSDRPLVSGVLLIVIAAMGLAVLGLGTNLLALIGAVFVILSGVLYLLGPVTKTLERAVPA